jgi:hypothetical protein
MGAGDPPLGPAQRAGIPNRVTGRARHAAREVGAPRGLAVDAAVEAALRAKGLDTHLQLASEAAQALRDGTVPPALQARDHRRGAGPAPSAMAAAAGRSPGRA